MGLKGLIFLHIIQREISSGLGKLGYTSPFLFSLKMVGNKNGSFEGSYSQPR